MARADVLARDDHDEAAAIVRNAHVIAKKFFDEKSTYGIELEMVHFRPRDGIYNKDHYMNTGAWSDGVKKLRHILHSMHYELNLTSSERSDLPPPETVTLPWLFRHLSWQVWLSFILIMGAVFSAGFFAARVNFFVQIYNLITKPGTP
jgi:hypothetical protein